MMEEDFVRATLTLVKRGTIIQGGAVLPEADLLHPLLREHQPRAPPVTKFCDPPPYPPCDTTKRDRLHAKLSMGFSQNEATMIWIVGPLSKKGIVAKKPRVHGDLRSEDHNSMGFS